MITKLSHKIKGWKLSQKLAQLRKRTADDKCLLFPNISGQRRNGKPLHSKLLEKKIIYNFDF